MFLVQRKTSKHYNVVLVMILLVICIVTAEPVHVDADVVYINLTSYGAPFHNGTDIRMPEADMQATLNLATDTSNFSCTYEIFTNTTQNMTLAIPYPTTYAGSYDVSVAANSTPIYYTHISWDQLGWNSSTYDEFNFNTDWIYNTTYAVFDLSLMHNTTSVIEVNILGVDTFSGVDVFYLQYFVGSTRTFYVDTHHRVHIEIIDEVDKITAKSFYPEDFHSIDTHNETTDVIWDFDVSEIGVDSILANLYIQTYTSTTTTTTTTTALLDLGVIIVGVVGIVSVVTLALVYFRRRQ